MAYKTNAFRFLQNTNTFEPITQKYLLSFSLHERSLFIERNKPFYFGDSLDSPKMTFNKRQQTFRFYPSIVNRVFISEEESYTHKLCKQVICEQNSISLNLNSSGLSIFRYNYSFNELLIYLPNGDYLIPDVLLYFKEPFELGYKWNRIVAVEIKVSHNVPAEKVELYKKLNIPVIEIEANKKWGREKEYDMSEEKRNELKNWIRNSFIKGYTADVLLDVTSKAYFENKLLEKRDNQIIDLQETLEDYKERINELKLKEENNKNSINLLQGKLGKISTYYQNKKLIVEKQNRVIDGLNDELKSSKESKVRYRNSTYILLSLFVLFLALFFFLFR